MPKKLTLEQLSGRVKYCGRWMLPEKVEGVRAYQREWARRNPGKKHTWRKANPDLARESARLSMRRLKDKLGGAAWATRSRKWKNYPAPTRPEPALCEICGCPPNGAWKRMHLDHDHVTGKFRGWLCDSHNRGLGLFRDRPDLLRKAAIYLEQNT